MEFLEIPQLWVLSVGRGVPPKAGLAYLFRATCLRPAKAGLRAGRLRSPLSTDYEAITRITNTLKNKEKSVKSFFQLCVI
jgi:hypothetical protein